MTRRGIAGPARIVCIDKGAGPTSFDVVRRVRSITGYRKVGHGGTLDPFATGLLVLGLGTATRLLGHLAAGRKSYRARVQFGRSTDTDDLTGQTLAESAPEFSRAELEAALVDFTGEIRQIPPRASALKIDGERSYDRFRRDPELAPPEARDVHVYALELVEFEPPEAVFKVECGGGTYVRSLARDLGEALGCPAHLSALRRESVGAISLDDALSLEAFEESWPSRSSGGCAAVHDPLLAVAGWAQLRLDAECVALVRQGRQPEAAWFDDAGFVTLPQRAVLLDEAGTLVALAELQEGVPRLNMVLAETNDGDI